MIVDAHVHVFPRVDSFTGSGELKSMGMGKVRRGTGEVFRLLPPAFGETCFRPETLVEYLDWVGVDKAVILQGGLYGFHNEYVADAVSKWPERLVGCALVDPMTQHATGVLRYAIEELGLKALKFECSEAYGLAGLHPKMQIDAPEWKNIFQEAKKHHLPLIFDPGLPGTIGYQVKGLRKLVESHPELDVVICHLGLPHPGLENSEDHYNAWKEMIALGENPNVWIDIASLPALFGDYEYPYPEAQRYLKMVYETLGSTRLLWGSDIPGILSQITYRQCLDLVKRNCSFLSPEEKENILGENAKKLFKL